MTHTSTILETMNYMLAHGDEYPDQDLDYPELHTWQLARVALVTQQWEDTSTNYARSGRIFDIMDPLLTHNEYMALDDVYGNLLIDAPYSFYLEAFKAGHLAGLQASIPSLLGAIIQGVWIEEGKPQKLTESTWYEALFRLTYHRYLRNSLRYREVVAMTTRYRTQFADKPPLIAALRNFEDTLVDWVEDLGKTSFSAGLEDGLWLGRVEAMEAQPSKPNDDFSGLALIVPSTFRQSSEGGRA